jgi:hypothetical protein
LRIQTAGCRMFMSSGFTPHLRTKAVVNILPGYGFLPQAKIISSSRALGASSGVNGKQIFDMLPLIISQV